MRRVSSRFLPLAMLFSVVTVLQLVSALEVDAAPTLGAEQTEGKISKHQSLKMLHHRFSGLMKVACQDRLVQPTSVTVTGEIRDGRISGIFVIDTQGWVTATIFDIGLNAFDLIYSEFNTQDFSASSFDRWLARMVWLDGEVNLKRIRLTTSFRFLDTLIKKINGKIELPDDLNITKCKASNLLHIKAI